jgi:hypothetical protein
MASDSKMRYEDNVYSMPTAKQFLKAMAGRKILFVTAFDEPINHLFKSGKIFQLYRNLETKPFQLKAIKAPMSLYPLRPGSSWNETLLQYQNLVDETIKSEGFDYFIASAGSYGVPLAHFAHESLDIPSFYGGHLVNSWFGVKTRGTRPPRDAILTNWIDGDLEHLRHVFSGIEGGRYMGQN